MRSLDLVAHAPVAEKTFRIFRATPRRTAAQNAARFIARIGERVIGFRRVRYAGQAMVAVNFYGTTPRPRIKTGRAKVWSAERPNDALSVKTAYDARH